MVVFTGIVKGVFPISFVKSKEMLRYAVTLPQNLRDGLEVGASVSVDGVCQTVVEITGDQVFFDAIQETLKVTTLNEIKEGTLVNIERSLKFGDEVGGHLLSGHVMDTAVIQEKIESNGETIIRFDINDQMKKYLFSKGYVAIDGISLTIVETDSLSVHLIPETLKMTTLGLKGVGDRVNIEIDQQTQAVVETVERIAAKKSTPNKECFLISKVSG